MNTTPTPELNPAERMQQAQLSVLNGTMLRITEALDTKSFFKGYREGMSGMSQAGEPYYTAYSKTRDNFMVYLPTYGFFRAVLMTKDEKDALVLLITPAPAPAYHYEVNCGYGDLRPVKFFVTLEEAYSHCQQELMFVERADDLDYLRSSLRPGARGECRLRGSGLRWVKQLETPVPAEAPAPKYNVGTQVRCLSQTGWLNIQERKFEDGAWRYNLSQRIDPMKSDYLDITAHEANLGAWGEPDPNARDDSKPGHKPALREVLEQMQIPVVLKTDLQIELYSRAFFFGKLTSASSLLEDNAQWAGWRTLRTLMGAGATFEYWMSPNYDQLVYTTKDVAGDTYQVPFKGWTILEGAVTYPELARVPEGAEAAVGAVERLFNIQNFTANDAANVMGTSKEDAARRYRKERNITGYARLHVTDSRDADIERAA